MKIKQKKGKKKEIKTRETDETRMIQNKQEKCKRNQKKYNI